MFDAWNIIRPKDDIIQNRVQPMLMSLTVLPCCVESIPCDEAEGRPIDVDNRLNGAVSLVRELNGVISLAKELGKVDKDVCW